MYKRGIPRVQIFHAINQIGPTDRRKVNKIDPQ